MSVCLHAKSYFSLGYGTASVEELVRSSADAGFTAVALTDIENLYGQVRFHRAAHAVGIQPITGIELREGYEARRGIGSRRGRIVLLARDRLGYQSLCRIVSERRGARHAPAGAQEDPVLSLERHPEGLVVLADSARTLARLHARALPSSSLLGALLIRPGLSTASESELVDSARAHEVPLFADTDVVMLRPEDRPLHVLQLAVRLGTTVGRIDDDVAESSARTLATAAGMADLFADHPSALENSQRIGEECALELLAAEPVEPGLDLGGVSPGARLEELALRLLAEGRRCGVWPTREHEQRLRSELRLFSESRLTSYLLVVAEIARFAREQGIPLIGRGSAASSLVCHVLGVTAIDPLEHGLYFERFLHPRRHDPPDVDIDISSERREEVIEHVHDRFGRNRVARVCALHSLQARLARREGLRALGILSSKTENADLAAESALSGPGENAISTARSLLIDRLIGMPSHVAVHPGGIVVADRAIEDHAPLELTQGGVVVTQYDLSAVAGIGLVKLDLLGNRCLDQIDAALRLVHRHHSTIRMEDLPRPRCFDPRWIPPADEAVIDLLAHAETVGCFQLETPAMRSLLAKVPVKGFRDCISALAVIRPGAAAGEAKETFIRRARGEETAVFPNPALEGVLRETHGVPLYDEDLLGMLSTVGGMSIAEADRLRSAIQLAGEDEDALRGFGQGFTAAAVRSGFALAEAQAVWDLLRRFAAYSFSKAHAASYALLAWQTAWLKAHHPAEFTCALLDHYGGHYPLRVIAGDAQRRGTSLLCPSVLRSERRCTLEPKANGEHEIRLGLGRIKFLRRSSIAALLSARGKAGGFVDFEDFLKGQTLTTRELEALVLTGACDGLRPLDREGFPWTHAAVLQAHGQRLLPAELTSIHPRDPQESGTPQKDRAGSWGKWRDLFRVREELRFLEMSPSGHIMTVLRDAALREGCITTREARTQVGKRVVLAAVLAATRRVRSAGRTLRFLTLEDEDGLLESVLGGAAFREFDRVITTPGPYLVSGRVKNNRGTASLEIQRIEPFHRRRRRSGGDGPGATAIVSE
jgi:DNA-directed DNA polymerase III PolC